MSLAVKLDENLGREHIRLVRARGHEADGVHDQGLSGAPDPIVWERALKDGRFFITLDLGFSDVRRYPPGSHPGILLLRPRSNSRAMASEILSRVLANPGLDALRGAVAVADANATRIRRAHPDQT